MRELFANVLIFTIQALQQRRVSLFKFKKFVE